jgi:hypothetical protein
VRVLNLKFAPNRLGQLAAISEAQSNKPVAHRLKPS